MTISVTRSKISRFIRPSNSPQTLGNTGLQSISPKFSGNYLVKMQPRQGDTDHQPIEQTTLTTILAAISAAFKVPVEVEYEDTTHSKTSFAADGTPTTRGPFEISIARVQIHTPRPSTITDFADLDPFKQKPPVDGDDAFQRQLTEAKVDFSRA
ncbi:MAG: hypothetical protein K2X01_06935 [Cyanobacteria bacterium]|nr:hypothetical protein [Cyanobacteriota bacterium]